MKHYRFFLSINGVLKGKRKLDRHLIHVTDIQGIDYVSPDLINEVERKAWRLVEEQLKTFDKTGVLTANQFFTHGEGENTIIQVKLLPEHSVRVMR